MDQENNKNKVKNWINRFLKIKRRLKDHTFSQNSNETCITYDPYEFSNLRPRQNSIRKSFKKVHSHVKSCIFPQEISLTVSAIVNDRPCTSQMTEEAPPPVPERTSIIQVEHSVATPKNHTHRIPTDEITSLSNCVWYWGPMTTAEAEERLQFKPDGTFLVRDSSSTSYLFSISFRTVGKTMHARIEYCRGKYNLCGTNTHGFSTITELIEDAMKVSENGIYCYSSRFEVECEFPVRLTKPISRYTEVRSLKHLCKFVIRYNTNRDDIPKLPLPSVLHSYLLEKPYF